ncbi:MAG: lytic transglycosylase domain-containing protein, partial [Chitinophagaceae bacterium]
MKNTVLLAMLLVLSQLSFSQNSSGRNSNSSLTAGTIPKNKKAKPVIIPTIVSANVEFPSIFKDHIEESNAYVEKFSKNRRDYLIRMHNRGKKIFPKVSAIFDKYDLPQELNVLIALESAFNPNARSSAGAFGYWQFMDDVAKEYGLSIISKSKTSGKLTAKSTRSKKKDDRSNFQKSTRAAARYLLDRKHNLGSDWLLVVASYNWGIGNVTKAIRKTGMPDASFWDIKKFLPAETRAYVMNFIAMNVVYNNYDNFLNNNLQFE